MEGPSGVGKSTTARRLAERLDAAYLAEAFERLTPPPSLRFRTRAELLALERRLLAEEGRRYRLARRLSARGRAVVADTGFFGPLGYSAGIAALAAGFDVRRPLAEEALALLAAGRWGSADRTFYLDADDAALDRREAAAAATHPADLAERHRRVADTERALWTRGRPPRARTLYAEASADAVARAVARALPDRRVPAGSDDGPSAVALALEFVVDTLGAVQGAPVTRAPGNR